jgi:hypothetical protein
MCAFNAKGPVAVVAHSYAVDLAAWLGEELILDLIVIIDPVKPGNVFAQPWATMRAPKAEKVVVFERTRNWFWPFTTRILGVEPVPIDAGHNSICRDKGVIDRIVSEVKAL